MPGATDKAACYQNPILHPDAWFMVRNNHPHDDGVYAALVCRFVCPLVNACPFVGDGYEIIARGGWFNSSGVFKENPPGLIDMQLAAAYIGVTVEYLRLLLVSLDTLKVHKHGARNYIEVEDMFRLAKDYGPRHGTKKMHRLHLIRGETPCNICLNPPKLGVPAADVTVQRRKRQRVQV